MTRIDELLLTLRRQGATIAVLGGRLRIEAPKGALTPELRGVLAAHKAEVVALLTSPAEQRVDRLVSETFERIAAFWVEGAMLPSPDLELAIEDAAIRTDFVALTAALGAYEAAASASCQAVAPCTHVKHDPSLIRWRRENEHHQCARCWVERGR